ncbi:hypothetical protein [Chitinivibrio alkaliphilus]|uniref:Uncharacterized protein n=1 Tax=Chitinivibrio alkaliphilus ACht1 TaxID=1313304 RepID=U7D929_9BACT|nr:hypothetical protein [Chitinivibrio alkaliphilus]ERP38894.1 hypothetical protein CALK_0672 [Chitinivibrio alkaliphilus ACht1]
MGKKEISTEAARKKTKNLSVLFAFLFFLFLFFVFINFTVPSDVTFLMMALIRASIGAMVFWVFCLIVIDIIVKSVVDDIDPDDLNPLEGGLEQHIHERKNEKQVQIVEIETGRKKKK